MHEILHRSPYYYFHNKVTLITDTGACMWFPLNWHSVKHACSAKQFCSGQPSTKEKNWKIVWKLSSVSQYMSTNWAKTALLHEVSRAVIKLPFWKWLVETFSSPHKINFRSWWLIVRKAIYSCLQMWMWIDLGILCVTASRARLYTFFWTGKRI